MTETGRLSAALADRYTIEREIGVGGMATVYLARDLRHDRLVALKVLRPELGAVIGAERFLAEIKLTANLQHPHILPLFDSGAVDGLLFYVMPYVEGVSVRERLLREKQLSIAESVKIATEVASALDYAHRRGIIHRDIKPENILLHDGQALVADFGIALAISTAGTRMTETGMSLGTPHYMSPEQAMGEREITARSDVYALGAVTYEMLVGEPPFTGPTAQSIVAKVLTEQPRPLLPKRHTIPRHVELAVLTALEKLPADRFATAAEFSHALNNPGAQTLTSSALVPARRVPRLSWPMIAAVVALVAAVASGLGYAAARVTGDDAGAERVVTRFVVTTPEDHRIGGSGLTVVALSPDGSTLIYVGQSSRGPQLYRRNLDELTATPIPGTEGALAALYSPDGRWITFPTGGAGLKRLPAAGGAVTPMSMGQLVPQAGLWLDNESFAVTALNGAIYAIDREGKPRLITAPDSSKGEAALILTDAIDGGRAVLAVAASGGSVNGKPFVIDVKNGKRRPVIDQLVNSIVYDRGYVAWVDQEGTLFAAPFDAFGKKPAGSPVTLAQQVRVSVGGAAQFAISRNGSLAYVPQRPLSLMLVDRSGKAEEVADIQRQFHSPRISPDGSRIALDFTHQGSRDVWTLDLAERTLSRLTFDNDGHDPVWDPTGTRIGYASARDGVIGMFMRNADGSGQRDSVRVGAFAEIIGAFLPGGERAVTIVTGTAGSFDLALTPMTGAPGEALLATNFNEYYPALSPDGRWLAYVSDESGQNEVYVRPLQGSGSKVIVSQNGGSEPVWSRRGNELFYRGFGVQGTPLMAVSVQTTPSFRVLSRAQLFDVSDYEPATPHANYDVGPDGRFVMVNQGRLSDIVVIQNWTEEVRRRGAGSN